LLTADQSIADLKQRANAQAVEGMARFGIRPAQALGISMIAEPQLVSAELMEEWVNDFDAWDACDQVCGNLFDKTPYAYQKATKWCQQEKEFVRRAAFVLMAELAVHDKQAQDETFVLFFPLIKRYADDESNFVKKAVNWALRQIGKRNGHLRALALECAYEIQHMDSKTARWVARDALRELQA
jgi:3-methyladenine DNA glycosylase AlkD